VTYAALGDRRWALPVALLLATPVFVGAPSLIILAAGPRLLDRRTRTITQVMASVHCGAGAVTGYDLTEPSGR
jgi:hypothetical protein